MPDREHITYDFEQDAREEALREKSESRFREGWRKAGECRQIEIRFPNGRRAVRFSQALIKAEPADGGQRRVRRCLGLEPAQSIPWRDFHACDHWLQVYGKDDDLIDALVNFVCEAERARDAMVVIATPRHRQDLTRQLVARGVDVNLALAEGRLRVFDADATLSRFLVGDHIDAQVFEAVVGDIVERARTSGRRVRAFGEMVGLLWERGQRNAMLQLEQLWHVFCQRRDLALFCAYPRRGFGPQHSPILGEICAVHTRVVG